jgi:hypothetical protein
MSDPTWTVIRWGRAENGGVVKTIAVPLGLKPRNWRLVFSPNIQQAMCLIRNAHVLCRSPLFFQELPLTETPPRGWKTDDTTFAEQAKMVLARKLTVERPRMGHLLESAQFRFTLLPEQGTRRGRSGWAVSSQCLVGETLRDCPDRKATRVVGSSSQDYE